MSTKDKLIVAEQICEFAIGFTVVAAVDRVIKPQGFVQKALTAVGGTAIAVVVGRAFMKEFVEVCDKGYGVDLKDRFI